VKKNVENVEKKLREAKFFLNKMSEQERLAFGDKEPFDFYLSAFLSAARTVDYRLCHEQAATYKVWRKTWDASLTPTENGLIKFMVDDRNIEVHESGSSHHMKMQGTKVVGNMYSDKSGTLTTIAAPGTSPTVIYKPAYNFTIAGTERKAAEACGEYLTLLEQMVTEFGCANT
jgi:hypothetical protein